MHLFKCVSGNQRLALGIGSTAVAWDRRVLGKASLASLQYRGKLGFLQPRKGLECTSMYLTEASKILSPLYSWHQWAQPAWLSSPRSHQLCLPALPLIPPFCDPSLGTRVQFYINFWETFHHLLSDIYHTSNIIWSLNSNQLDWSLLHCNSYTMSDLRKLHLSHWWNNFSLITLLRFALKYSHRQ